MEHKCRNCKWMKGLYGWKPDEDYHEGTCQRHAPIAKDDMGRAKWPVVKGGDSCGDFESITPLRIEFVGNTPRFGLAWLRHCMKK